MTRFWLSLCLVLTTSLGLAEEKAPSDVFVDAQGLIYVTDFNAGLHILEYKGS